MAGASFHSVFVEAYRAAPPAKAADPTARLARPVRERVALVVKARY